jgi:hypothetical protein
MKSAWLREIVCWDMCEYIPRHVAISRFVTHGLYPFILSNGYCLYDGPENLKARLADMLYMNRGKSFIECCTPDMDSDEDHKIHYYYVLSDKWDEFWEKWALWKDLNDWRGPDRQLDIQEFCWSQLNLDDSSQTQVVEELLGNVNEAVDDIRDED